VSKIDSKLKLEIWNFNSRIKTSF